MFTDEKASVTSPTADISLGKSYLRDAYTDTQCPPLPYSLIPFFSQHFPLQGITSKPAKGF